MNDLFKDKLTTIVSDELLIASLRAVFDERIEKEKPQILEIEDNASLGERYRAYEVAKILIEEAFKDLKNYETGKKPIKGFNKER